MPDVRRDQHPGLDRLADEQAALRRVATLVAQGVGGETLFSAVCEEVGRLFGAEAAISRLQPETHRTTPPARHDWTGSKRGPGPVADRLGKMDIGSTVAAPVIVEGTVWGVMRVTRLREALPPDTEEHVERFTELVATAIANAESRAALGQLVAEQAALRRVAELVARGVGAEELFQAVSREVADLFGADCSMGRFERDDAGVALVAVGMTEGIPLGYLGMRIELEEFFAATTVYRTGRPAWQDPIALQRGTGPLARAVRQLPFLSAAAAPIVAQGELWGAMHVVDTRNPLPPNAVDRIQNFTELVAAAIDNAESRASLGQLADEQAALRRVAELVARGVPPHEVFTAVSRELARRFGGIGVITRFESDGLGYVVVGLSDGLSGTRLGERYEHQEALAITKVYRTGLPARNDARDLEALDGPAGDVVRRMNLVSTVAAPIVVEGGLWGAMAVADANRRLPSDAEERLHEFTGLVATAIANAQSRRALARLAEEQAALRRVAELVARGAASDEIFSAVSVEVGQLFGSNLISVSRFEPGGSALVIVGVGEGVTSVPVGSRFELDEAHAASLVYRTGRPARRDRSDYDSSSGVFSDRIRQLGLVSVVSAPIIVDGDLWGVITISDPKERLPADSEQRLQNFTELVATAIANADSRAELAASQARALDLANEQAALRRVATLAAEGASAETLFSAVAREAASVIKMPVVGVHRFDTDRTFTTVGIAGDTTVFTLGSRWPVQERSMAAAILATGRPARKDDYAAMAGPIGAAMRDDQMASAVGVPVVVDGGIWGFVIAGARPGTPIPHDAEERLARFTALVGTAIANLQARARLADLAEEQAALRRVATLVGRGADPEEVFSAVSNEVGQLFQSDQAAVARFDADGSGMVVVGATPGIRGVSVGTHWRLEEFLLSTTVYRTGRPARNDHASLNDATGPIADTYRAIGAASNVAAPITVEGELWGVMTVSDLAKRLPAEAEQRLESFTELIGTAIANAQSRRELAGSRARAVRLAREQAALRRVATLVARSAEAEDVLAAVVECVRDVFEVELVAVCRYQADEMLVLSSSGVPAFPVGSRLPLNVPSIPASVYETGRAVRIDDYSEASGLHAVVRDWNVKSAVGAPIIVDGAVWGSINVATVEEERLPPDVEDRLARFTDLIATAVSNAAMRGELAASRARVIAAADESRRKIERDLHDGAQQQLVTLAVALHRAKAQIPAGHEALQRDLDRIAHGLTRAIQQLQDLSRGIHPAILSEGGLSPALKALARRSSMCVELDLGCDERFSDPIEVAAYYIVSEALTNASKHSGATRVWVSVRHEGSTLRLSVRDDGAGGAQPGRGSGLIGLKDRVEALDGRFGIESPVGRGTRIVVEIPVPEA